MTWQSFRSGLQTVHLWAGIALSLPFVLLGISGSILMLQPEIPRFYMPHANAAGERQPLERIIAAARAAAPEGTVATRLALPERFGEPASVRFAGENTRGNNAGVNVYVDPVSLEILGAREPVRVGPFFTVIRTMHATLYVRTISDRSFIGWLGIALSLLCISGLVLWWPRNGQWAAAFGVKAGAKGFRLHRDLHSASGIWTLILLLVVSVSGLQLAFPRTFRAAVGAVLSLDQNFSVPPPVAIPGDGASFTLDETVALAQSAVPGIEPFGIQLANGRARVTVMTFVPADYGPGAPQILISADPDTGQIVYIDDPRRYGLGERVVLWQRLLHSGLGLGLAYKVLVFVSGFLPLLFAITGVRMWWLKRAQRRAMQGEPAPAPAE